MSERRCQVETPVFPIQAQPGFSFAAVLKYLEQRHEESKQVRKIARNRGQEAIGARITGF
jgi:hypothetical protein